MLRGGDAFWDEEGNHGQDPASAKLCLQTGLECTSTSLSSFLQALVCGSRVWLPYGRLTVLVQVFGFWFLIAQHIKWLNFLSSFPEQPHTYLHNEAGTRPRTAIAHPHRSTRPRWAHHAVHGSVWQFATFWFDEIELKLFHFRSTSLWMFDFLYQPIMSTRLPPWGSPRVNHV